MLSFLQFNKHNNLCNLLEKAGCLTHEKYKEATRQSKHEDRPLVEVLFEAAPSQAVQDKMLQIFADFYGMPYITLRRKVISTYILDLIPKEVADQNQLVVFKKEKNIISVATVDPENYQVIEFIKKKTNLEPKVFLTTPTDINIALKKYPSKISDEFAKIIQDSISETMSSRESAEKLAEHIPIIKMVETVIDQALVRNASDVHFEPNTFSVVIRFRIDGLLQKIVELPRAVLPPLVARLKLMANLKLDEHRQPQDGRFKFMFSEREVAIRVSAIPTLHGTKVVLRLLDAKNKQFTLVKLGLNQRDLAVVKEEISKPHGMVLVTGPTGSGKTTTLYTILQLMHREHVNICTIEDPVEYSIEGINQMQVNSTVGLTFASGLRSLLRQDPDIVMVGEIRDAETADIAINSAMTGHMVLSSLHTNDAFMAVQRLTEMDVPPFLTASVVNLIIGQRLVRKICFNCRVRYPSSAKIWETYGEAFNFSEIIDRLKKLNLLDKTLNRDDIKLYHGRGCEKCGNTGYKGRIGIYEVLAINKELSDLIRKNSSSDVIKQQSLQSDALTMLEDGFLKVFLGQTTFEEVMRVTKD